MLKGSARQDLGEVLEAIDYSCGAVLSLFIDEDEVEEEAGHPLKSVFVPAAPSCSQPVEDPYFSSRAFPWICYHCATHGVRISMVPLPKISKAGRGLKGSTPCAVCVL